MKVALVHDYLKEYGGAERVLEALSEMFPDAPIYTSVYLPSYLGPHRARFENKIIRTSWFQYVPFNAKLLSPFRFISPLVFRSFDLSKYDLIIVSQTGAYFPNAVKKGKAKLISYTHTPPRYLYGYKTAREWKRNIVMKIGGEVAGHFMRIVDYNASKNVDQFIANSEEVKHRIEKFYRRDAVVVNPPVDITHSTTSSNKKEYYLTGGRLARAKGTDIIIEAFNKNGLPLKIFGKGFAGFEEELREKAHKNIEFVGEVEDSKKFNLMAGAKAFIFASFDEDFGITPVEAMSVGCPVISHKSGGVQETILDKKTGVFYEPNTAEAINTAIKEFTKLKITSEACITQAEKFSKEHFVKRIKKLVEQVYEKSTR